MFSSGSIVSFLHLLGIIFDDVGEALTCKRLPPKVVGLDPIGIGRVAGAVVPSFVEREEPGVLPPQVGAEKLAIDGVVG